jgi:ribosome maturation protein Sdo1
MQDTKKRKIINKVVSRFKTPIDPDQLHKGLDVEREHASANDGAASKSTDVVKGNKMKIAKIATVHLKEDPKYYTHLKAMEKRYSK